MLSKVQRLFGKARSRVVWLFAVEASELLKKINKPNDDVEANYLGLKTILVCPNGTTVIWKETAKL